MLEISILQANQFFIRRIYSSSDEKFSSSAKASGLVPSGSIHLTEFDKSILSKIYSLSLDEIIRTNYPSSKQRSFDPLIRLSVSVSHFFRDKKRFFIFILHLSYISLISFHLSHFISSASSHLCNISTALLFLNYSFNCSSSCLSIVCLFLVDRFSFFYLAKTTHSRSLLSI